MQGIKKDGKIDISLSQEELRIIGQSLNEVCNGVRELGNDDEFSTRMGTTRLEVLKLLKSIGNLVHQSE